MFINPCNRGGYMAYVFVESTYDEKGVTHNFLVSCRKDFPQSLPGYKVTIGYTGPILCGFGSSQYEARFNLTERLKAGFYNDTKFSVINLLNRKKYNFVVGEVLNTFEVKKE